jgi:site-specific DNA-cytosine methylase
MLDSFIYKGVRADGRPLITLKEGEFDDIKDSLRMLTPEECELLQGLPTGYTEGFSKTQRYKALGNAFTLPVIKHLLKWFKN